MRTVLWDRGQVIREIRDRIWTHLSPTLARQTLALEVSRLLQLPEHDLYSLARIHFLASDQVGSFLDDLPSLVRRLTTTTTHEQESSLERVRGAIEWPTTITRRLATGQPHLYVTRPARRAYQTPANSLLAFTLDQVASIGKVIGWQGAGGIAAQIGARTTAAERWRSHRAIQEIQRARPSTRDLIRIAQGPSRRRYAAVLEAFELWRQLIAQLDTPRLRELIEQHALVTTQDPILFEIRCAFEILESLHKLSWRGDKLRVFHGGLTEVFARDQETITVWYQQVPAALANHSRYRDIQRAHRIPVGSLRPDLVLRRDTPTGPSWLLVECKLSEKRVEQPARAALVDLLAYRRAFDASLAGQRQYGLGIVWGAELSPSPAAEVMLCTHDQIYPAVRAFAA